MAKKLYLNKLISVESIDEPMKLIEESETDYITPSGNVYKDYGNGKFFKKKTSINNHNGYLYVGITYPSGNKSRRVHVLVAKAFLPNPNNYPVVMHIDNDKTNPNVNNLQWGTVSENTQKSYDDGLQVNDKSWDDSQSIPVSVFNLNKELLYHCGSVGEAYRKTGITKTTILNQCSHNVITHPRKGYYFRYYDEYIKQGFVL